MAGGITFFSEERDSGWCCEPCNTIETEIDDLEDRLREANKRTEEAWETAEAAIKINNLWAMKSATGVSRRAQGEGGSVNEASGSREEERGATSPRNNSKAKAGRLEDKKGAAEA